jgi:hypothetical protein
MPGNDQFSTVGFNIIASNSTVQGLAINNFGGTDIYITGNNNNIQGNFIGTNASGTQAPFAPNLNQLSASDHLGIEIGGGSANVIGTNGDLTGDELSRINDSVAAVDATLAPFGVAVRAVSDPDTGQRHPEHGRDQQCGRPGGRCLGLHDSCGINHTHPGLELVRRQQAHPDCRRAV